MLLLRREENFACVRIFNRSSRREPDDLDITRIGRERAGNQAGFTGDGRSVWQVSFLIARERAGLRPTNVGLTRRRRRLLVQSLTSWSIIGRRLFTLMSAPVRPRRLSRLGDCATQRFEEIPEGPCVRYISYTE